MSVLFISLSIAAQTPSVDAGFRLKEGICQKDGRYGLNPEFLGECGFTTRRFDGFQIVGGNFKGLVIRDGALTNANLEKSDFSYAKLEMCRTGGSSFRDAIFNEARLNGCQMYRTIFDRAQFRNANLNGIKASEAIFTDADFKNAKMIGAFLTRADLRRADFRGADLTLAHFDLALLKGSRFDRKTKLPFSEKVATDRGMVFEP